MVLLTETESEQNLSPFLCMMASLIQVDPYDDYAEMPGLLPFLKRLTFSVVVHVDPIGIPY